MTRIHIVGCSRSGTTLALEAIANSFTIDRYAKEERGFISGLRKPEREGEIYLTKRPRDYVFAPRLLPREPDFYWVFLIRDPRDVVVSRHKQDPSLYWTNLGHWRHALRAARAAGDHPQFLRIRYEDLVRDPDRVERMLVERMPFLELRQPLRDFHRTAQPSEQSVRALHGVRPIDTASIGRWREHKPRVAGQLERYGPITDELIELGYERDDSWLRELEGVSPDRSPSIRPETTLAELRRRWIAWRLWHRYRRIRRQRPKSAVRSSLPNR
ncbi:MAG: sulfotransferase [Planctomycetota bacterium]